MHSSILFGIILCITAELSYGKNTGCPFADEHPNEELSEDRDRDDEVADPDTTTPNQCKCSSLCETSVGAGNYRYDWCSTEDDCGEHTLFTGYWDKCKYLNSAKPDYIKLTWQKKQEQMWENVKSDDSYAPYPSATGIFKESVQTVFDDEWDVMPAGRKKYIHSVGAVCPFVVNIKDSPYTGVFQNGEQHGLIRLGSAIPLEDKGVTPGGGVKFFRTGRSSANFVILNQLGPMADKNYNFFDVPLSNHIPADMPFGFGALALKFCQAQSCPTKVGISDVCRYDQEGNEAENPVFPFKVSFVPTGDIKFEKYTEVPAYYKQFTDLPSGTTLYTLMGHQSPDDEEGFIMGDVVTTEKCVTSFYGDTKLFFKHQYINEDKALKPEWTDGYEKECTNYCVIHKQFE